MSLLGEPLTGERDLLGDLSLGDRPLGELRAGDLLADLERERGVRDREGIVELEQLEDPETDGQDRTHLSSAAIQTRLL